MEHCPLMNLLMTQLDKDEQFYRDTENIAFPKLDDRQLAMLEPLGTRRIVRRGETLMRRVVGWPGPRARISERHYT